MTASDFDAELRPLRDATRAFLDNRASSAEVHRIAATQATLDRDYWSAAAELGWTSLLVPEEAGGGTVTGRPFAELAVLADEAGRHVAPGPLVPGNVVAWLLSQPGNGEHGDAVAAIVKGSAVAAWALAEGRDRWDPAGVTARGERTSDGFTITGTKRFVESAADADLFLVTARDGDGIGQFLVDRNAPGVVVTPQRALDPTRGFGTVEFTATPVPASGRVGPDDGETRWAELAYRAAIAIQAAETAGLMRHVFDMTMDWVTNRVAFGRLVGSYQAIKHRLAEHLLRVEASAGAAAGLAAALDAGSPEAGQLASAAKAYIGDAAVTLAQDAIQMHGGIGMTWEHDLHLYLRRAATNRVLYGDPAWHRERLCRLAGV
jgi:alkylation response protein AidB-like acyl-CoA dehydrogenase